MQQIAYWKQGKAKSSTVQIDVVTNAIGGTPTQPGKQVKRFADMRSNYHHQTSRTEQLQPRSQGFTSNEQGY